MKFYRGYRVEHLSLDGTPTTLRCVVRVEDDAGRRRPLPLRLDVRNHSPTGFEWGYVGSGPTQLALALCMDALKDRRRALHVYMQVKFRLVGRLPHDGWTISHAEMLALVHAIEDEERVGEIGSESPAE